MHYKLYVAVYINLRVSIIEAVILLLIPVMIKIKPSG